MNNWIDFISENLEVYVKCSGTSEFRTKRWFFLLVSIENLRKKH